MVVILDKSSKRYQTTNFNLLKGTPSNAHFFWRGPEGETRGSVNVNPGFRKEILSRLKIKTVPDLIDDKSHELKITIPIGIISVHFVGPELKNSIETSIDTCKL